MTKSSLGKKEFILAYGFRGEGVHHGGGSIGASGKIRNQRSHLPLQTQSREWTGSGAVLWALKAYPRWHSPPVTLLHFHSATHWEQVFKYLSLCGPFSFKPLWYSEHSRTWALSQGPGIQTCQSLAVWPQVLIVASFLTLACGCFFLGYFRVQWVANLILRMKKYWRDAQQLRALTASAEDLGLVPSTYMTDHNYLVTLVPGNLMPSFGLCRHCMHVVHIYEAKHSYILKN